MRCEGCEDCCPRQTIAPATSSLGGRGREAAGLHGWRSYVYEGHALVVSLPRLPMIARLHHLRERYDAVLVDLDGTLLDGDERVTTRTRSAIQALVQADSHTDRLAVFDHIIGTERKRLAARATLKSMFKSTDEGPE